mmetsp:Transcript_17758/g.33360  ORF Transcript_17758/g.33360 Transcript_17758/m.33360 type:complete len:219 (-) Transcript_17758:398-1054(-)
MELGCIAAFARDGHCTDGHACATACSMHLLQEAAFALLQRCGDGRLRGLWRLGRLGGKRVLGLDGRVAFGSPAVGHRGLEKDDIAAARCRQCLHACPQHSCARHIILRLCMQMERIEFLPARRQGLLLGVLCEVFPQGRQQLYEHGFPLWIVHVDSEGLWVHGQKGLFKVGHDHSPKSSAVGRLVESHKLVERDEADRPLERMRRLHRPLDGIQGRDG